MSTSEILNLVCENNLPGTADWLSKFKFRVLGDLGQPALEMVYFRGGLVVALKDGEIVFVTFEKNGDTVILPVKIG